MTIQVLNDVVAAQIAAGEVVERPASVVKELIENALDAGATTIHVDIEEGGRKLIRISDNGHGIAADEVLLAFKRHATSKITAIEDLDRIATLGFRGEALYSIAAVSRLTLTTRSREEDTGTYLTIWGGLQQEIRPTGAPAGTVIVIADLFYNTPARLKFLKGPSTERRHITSLITSYATAYPEVSFTLQHDGREVFRSYGTGNLADVLSKTLGTKVFKHMLEVVPQPPSRPDLPPIAVHGYTSATEESRANRSHINLFVNGRAIRDTSLTYAVAQAYHTLLPKGRYPISVLMINMPPEEVDVNVHPTKAEVRFRNPNAVFSAVQRAVRSAVVAQSPAPQARLDPTTGEIASGWQSRRNALLRTDSAAQQPISQQRLDLSFNPEHRPTPGNQSLATFNDAQVAPPASSTDAFAHIPEGAERPSQPRTLPMLRVVGQIGASYIVAEGPVGMYLVDQHAAHERILFEQMMAQRYKQEAISQQTLEAVTIELPLSAVALIEENLDSLAAMGFVLEPFGGQTVLVRAVPAMMAGGDPEQALRVILEDLEIGAKPGQKTLEEMVALHVCKAAAVKAGQVMTIQEMQSLIQQLERCEAPHTCPHGRPTLIHISERQLEREFGRT